MFFEVCFCLSFTLTLKKYLPCIVFVLPFYAYHSTKDLVTYIAIR